MSSFFLKYKDDKPMKNVGSFFFTPAIFMGLFSSVSPCAIATLLVFFIFLSLFCATRKQVILFGIFFIAAVLLTKFLLVNDLFYLFFAHPVAIKVYKILYQVLSVIFVLIGGANIVDWIRLKRHPEDIRFLIRYPSFLNDINGGVSGLKKYGCYEGLTNKKNFVLVLLFAMFLGFFCTVLGSLWPQDYVFFVENFVFTSHGNNIAVQLRIFVYSFFFTLPCWLLWSIVIETMKSKGAEEFISRHVSVTKVIFSALFISLGVALIYIVRN